MGWCLVRCLIFDLSISISVVSVDAVVETVVCVGVDDTPLPKIQNLVPTFSPYSDDLQKIHSTKNRRSEKWPNLNMNLN